MRVLHFFKTYFPDSYGGGEQFIYQLARGTAARGANVDVLSLSPQVRDETRRFDNHTVHRLRQTFEIASTGVALRAFRKFSALAAEADIVHYHFPWPFADVVHLATRVTKPSVVTYHSDIVRQARLMPFYRPLMNRFLGSVDLIVATSPDYVATSETLRRYRDKVRVVPIGLDPATYPTPEPAVLAQWRNRIGDDFVLFVGALRYYKGLHILLDAVKDSAIPVVIVGTGPLEAELRRRIAERGLENVRMTGALPDRDKIALLDLCRAFVFPSHLRSEAFGISLLEAAMFGKPMVTAEIGTGTSYVNRHGETGLIVPPDDAAALRVALQQLTDDRALAADMGARARQRFLSHFTLETMVDGYMTLYDELLSSSRKSR